MQENNFEKEVQQELDELRMNPSENVWLKVEASLKKKKDRRVLVLLLSLFFLAGAGLLTYNFYNTGSTGKQTQSTATSTPVKKGQPSSVAGETRSNNSSITATIIPASDTPAFAGQQKKPSSLLVLAPQKSLPVSDETMSSTVVNGNKTLLFKTAKIRRYIGATTAVQSDGAVIETIDEAETASLPSMQRTTFNLSGLIFNSTKKELHFANKSIDGSGLTKPGISSAKLEAVSKKAAVPGRKITISIEAGIGRSGTANSYLGNIPNNSFYDYASPLNSSTGTVTVPDSLRPYNVNPSAVKPGAGFFAGILFTKKISGRSSISAGLSYQLLTTSQSVGTNISYRAGGNQREETVFKAGIGNSYTNSYHLLQVPIEFNTQLSGFKQHNIFLATGISLSQLIHTNALQFNNVSRQYFRDNSFFNKTTVGFSSGLFVNLRKDTKSSLLLGPLFQYSFTPLADKGLYANSHYSFLGLRMQKALRP